MCRTKGAKNRFDKKALYFLTSDVVTQEIERRCKKEKLTIPKLDKGNLNEFARKKGFAAAWTNGKEGLGYREKYTGQQIYDFVDTLIDHLKDKQLNAQISLETISVPSIKAKKERSVSDIQKEIEKLQKELEDKIANEKPDFENMKPGDRFFYLNLEWVCLDPEYTEPMVSETYGGTGVLAIVAEPYWSNEHFWEGDEASDGTMNNYRESYIRKKLLDELAPRFEGKVIEHFPDSVMENGEEKFPGYFCDPIFLLSVQEYIKYAKYIPYDEYDDWFWLRSPYPSSAYTVRIVGNDGSLNGYYAYSNTSVAPACIFNR